MIISRRRGWVPVDSSLIFIAGLLTDCDVRVDLEVHGQTDLALLVPGRASVSPRIFFGLEYE